MSTITIPVGPQHPLLKEPISFSLDIAGERVESARVNIGYVHRGMEKLCQQRTYTQNVALVECVCGICSHAHTTAYCQAVESLAQIEVPLRATYIRVLLCELERIHSHLLWLGVLSEAIGFTVIFMYAWREREAILDILEEISGGRVAHGANVIGGVRIDISPEQAHQLSSRLREFSQQTELFRDLIERDRSFHRRTEGIGIMSRDAVHQFGVVGPSARASGCHLDLRVAQPYAAYSRLAPSVITATEGDVWSRAQVRLREIMESINLCQQALQALPAGALIGDVPRRMPPGEAVARVEAPRGELLYYVCSDGGPRPARVKIRTPSLPALLALEQTMPGLAVADIASVVAAADLCVACADR
jgi:NADH-quinone oxidoreductase subunit D